MVDKEPVTSSLHNDAAQRESVNRQIRIICLTLKLMFPIFNNKTKHAMSQRDKNIYVIELDLKVLEDKRFRDANPNYVEGKKCFYVGRTGRTPEERFQQHKSGYKSNRLAKKFGVCLRPRHYEKHNPMTYEESIEMEIEKTRRLRKRGYGVWSN